MDTIQEILDTEARQSLVDDYEYASPTKWDFGACIV